MSAMRLPRKIKSPTQDDLLLNIRISVSFLFQCHGTDLPERSIDLSRRKCHTILLSKAVRVSTVHRHQLFARGSTLWLIRQLERRASSSCVY